MISEAEIKDLLIDPQTDWFYLGEIDEELISTFVALMENRSDFLMLPRPYRRRLVSVMVECLQNIQSNTVSLARPQAGSVVFLQRFALSKFSVLCGNIMQSDEVELLKQKLDRINSAEPDKLRDMYMKQMELSLQSGSRTNAGLGLLEIARVTNGPIKYKFLPLKDGYTFFSLELFLSLN